MNTRARAEAFARYLGLELKGRIVSQGFTALKVAQTTGRSPAAFNRWLNGKVDIPVTVLCEASEVIGVEPQEIVDAAYSRMVITLGELDGTTYDPEAVAHAHAEVDAIEKGAPLPMSQASYTLAAHDRDIQSEYEGHEEMP